MGTSRAKVLSTHYGEANKITQEKAVTANIQVKR